MNRHLIALENTFWVPKYLLRMIRNYLNDREQPYDTTLGMHLKIFISEAAQGSILGSDLWNIFYYGILRMDRSDIVAVIVARKIENTQKKLNQVILRTSSWLTAHGLKLAMPKTEIVLLTSKHIPIILGMRVGDKSIVTKHAFKYLEVRLDTKLTYWTHIKYTAEKAANTTTYFIRLMGNVGGPTYLAR